MPQVLPEGTGGPRLRAGPGGVFGDAVTSVALALAIVLAYRCRVGASDVCTPPSLPRASDVPPNLPRLSLICQAPPADLSRPAFTGAHALLGGRPGV